MRIKELCQRELPVKMYIPCIAGCILVLLFLGLVVTGSRALGRGNTIAEARNSIAAAEYTELTAAIALYETSGYPNANLMGDILPTVRMRMHTAEVLDEILSGEYGTAYSLLDANLYRYIQLTMDEIQNAFAQGQSTQQGEENMSAYMLMLKENLVGRFNAAGEVLPLQ